MTNPRQLLLLMTDTQRWDMLGCYKDTGLRTPHLDRLAAQGLRFERAYTCQPVCGPARSALFTGLYPHSNGSWANSLPLGANVKTIGQRLQAEGFHTAYIGKWHLDGGDYFGLGRCPDGWDPAYWYDMRNYLEELPEAERRLSRKPESMAAKAVSADFTYAQRCSERAIRFLTEHPQEDFLLVVSYDEPHHPYLCPEPYASMYQGYEFPKAPNVWDRLEHKPEHQRVWSGQRWQADRDQVKIAHPYYFGCNSFVDAEIGRVLEAVDDFVPGALVVYTSDHGDMLESHSLTNKGPFMYDEVTRVPLLARWPGRVPAGSLYTHPASHISLVPTLMEAAGLPLPQWREGPSLLPALLDPQVRVSEQVFMEFGRYEVDHDAFSGFQPIRAACDGRYKLVINLLTSDELYDLENDPGELENLIGAPDHAQARDRLHDSLLDWLNDTRDPFRGYYWERRPWRADASPASALHTGKTRQREHEEYEPRQLDYATGVEMTKAVRPMH